MKLEMESRLANRVYFKFWGKHYLKDVEDVKDSAITCLELMKSCEINNSDDINHAIEEIKNLYT